MKTLRKFMTEIACKKEVSEADLTSQTTLGSSSSAQDASIKNVNRNYLPSMLSKTSNPNTTSSQATPNFARPRSFDATPDRQANLSRGYFNANLGNKMGVRLNTTDNNKLGIK